MKKEQEVRIIDEGDFTLLLSQIAQQLANELAHVENIPEQIQLLERTGHRIIYYLTPDGSPAYKAVKKQSLGFKT